MPMPAKVETGTGALPVNDKFTVTGDARLEAALTRFIARLARQTGIQIMARTPVKGAEASLKVTVSGRAAGYPTLGEDESYTLDITRAGATIQAATVDGALHGLETFAQAVQPTPEGFAATAMRIEDHPRFAWRGLMMDVSRHFMPVETVERNLDAMAAVKLNVLHWHLSDDQGFRVESRLHPRLQQLGSDGLYYTQSEIRAVVAYARERGIRVYPEFDIPGHSASWLPGYPSLASVSKGPFEIWRTFGISQAVLDPTRESTYSFLDSFIGEMAALFPDKYFHIGGDEVVQRPWQESERIQAFEKSHGMKDGHDLQAYFNKRVLRLVTKHGKTMIGWDEILHPDLPKATVVHIWRNQDSLANAVRQGHRTILSAGYYIDHLSPARFHYGVDPLGGAAAQLTEEQAKNVLGGEACMWAELVSSETVDSRIWPRTAAIAERLWSARDVTDVSSMYNRLEAVSRNLEFTGVTHRSHYGAMLDRIAGGERNEPLRILADAAEGLGCCSQRRPARINTQTPLNRFADAVRPESETVRAMENAAARLAVDPSGDAADAAVLREQFTQWSANDVRFQVRAGDNALLAEVKPLSADLSNVGAAGLRILDAWSTGATLPPDWLADQNTQIARMLKPYPSEVILAAARVLKVMVDSVAPKGR
jgi:hexosaminidase